jgi:hypothetical protein
LGGEKKTRETLELPRVMIDGSGSASSNLKIHLLLSFNQLDQIPSKAFNVATRRQTSPKLWKVLFDLFFNSSSLFL